MALLDGYITVKEASDIVGCSIGFIRVRIQDGRLGSVKLGNRSYVLKDEILNLVQHTTPQNNDNIIR